MVFCTEEKSKSSSAQSRSSSECWPGPAFRLIKYWFSITARSAPAGSRPHRRSAKTMEVESDGPGVPAPLGRLHARQGIMLERTHFPEAPWWVVQAVDKKRARLNCIHHRCNSLITPRFRSRHRESVFASGNGTSTTPARQCRRRCSCRRSTSHTPKHARAQPQRIRSTPEQAQVPANAGHLGEGP